jgi:hypothetical protein
MKDIVVLDTSIFIKENFLHGNKIKSLNNLSKKGEIDLYITEITYEEILANFAKDIGLALSAKRKFEKEHRVLRNNVSFNTFFSKFDKKELIESFKKEIDGLINKNIIKKIPYTSLNIGNVFKKYFNTTPPFSDGNKKAEFPDAFSIELIKEYFKGQQLTTPIKVFSTDRDFLNCNENDLSFSDNYEDYINNINLLLLQRKKIIIEKMFEDSKDEFENEFKSWFENNLDDVSLYYGTVIFTENIYDIEIEKVIVNDLQYKIIDINDDIVTIKVYADVFVSVDILTDDEDTMYYDSDDKEYHYFEQKKISTERTFKSSIISTAEIISEEDFSDFEIESINEDLVLNFNYRYDNKGIEY